jgi:alkanesulfonate monooxygenase SsuD/methylene tetrahydromethanopterin reductase-like flavin-dependent oxidoreductase (luciferase family)
MIQFGVMANTHPAPGTDLTRMVDELITEAQQAERAGFDSFFLTEHHQEPSGYFPSPLPLAAALDEHLLGLGIELPTPTGCAF